MLPLAGDSVELGQWTVGSEFVAEYLGVVEDRSTLYGELDIVPPMALAACAVGALVEQLALPLGQSTRHRNWSPAGWSGWESR